MAFRPAAEFLFKHSVELTGKTSANLAHAPAFPADEMVMMSRFSVTEKIVELAVLSQYAADNARGFKLLEYPVYGRKTQAFEGFFEFLPYFRGRIIPRLARHALDNRLPAGSYLEPALSQYIRVVSEYIPFHDPRRPRAFFLAKQNILLALFYAKIA